MKPYNRITLAYLGKEVGVGPDEAEELIVQLILDGKVDGRIDQQNGLLDLSGGSRATSSTRKFAALESWSKSTMHVATELNGGIHGIFTREGKGVFEDAFA